MFVLMLACVWLATARAACPVAELTACSVPLINAYLDITHPSEATVKDMCRLYHKFVKCLSVNHLDVMCSDYFYVAGVEGSMGYLCGKGKQGYLDNIDCIYGAMGMMSPSDCEGNIATLLKSMMVLITVDDRNITSKAIARYHKMSICAVFSWWTCYGTKLDEKCGNDAGDWWRAFVKYMQAAVGLNKLDCTLHTAIDVGDAPQLTSLDVHDCSETSVQNYLATCLYRAIENLPARPYAIPSYAEFFNELCRHAHLPTCWQPVRDSCPAVTTSIYQTIVDFSLIGCQTVYATIETKCDVTEILTKYNKAGTNSTCNINNDYMINFVLKMLFMRHIPDDMIKDFATGVFLNQFGIWFECIVDGTNRALPEIRQTCGSTMYLATKKFAAGMHSLSEMLLKNAKALYPKRSF